MTAPDRPGTPETAGQAAYEEWKRQFDASLLEDWDEDLSDSERDGWGKVSAVAISTYLAQTECQVDRDVLAIAAAAPATAGEGGVPPAYVPREPLEALIRAWSAKADEPDRDPYAAAAYRIAKGNLVGVIADAQQPGAYDPNHEPGLSECGCRMCDPQRHGLPQAALDLARAETAAIRAAAANTARELAELRERISDLAEQVTASARATEPSRKSQIEHELAIELRKLLEDQ